jgi:hypothetical protein
MKRWMERSYSHGWSYGFPKVFEILNAPDVSDLHFQPLAMLFDRALLYRATSQTRASKIVYLTANIYL